MPRIIVPICLHSGQTIAKLLTNRDSKKLLTDHNISFEFIDKSIGTVNICDLPRKDVEYQSGDYQIFNNLLS